MLLTFLGFPHTPTYQGEHVPDRVKAGDTVTVSAESGKYLIEAFAGAGPDGGAAFVEPKAAAPKLLAGDAVVKAADQPAEKPAEKPTEKPAAHLAEKSADKPAPKPEPAGAKGGK